MILINPSVAFEPFNSEQIYKKLEKHARTCYKSEEYITGDSYREIINLIMKKGHLSVLEHVSLSAKIITDRGVMAELTRHRAGVVFSIESTRYANYTKDKFGNQLTFVIPHNIEIKEGHYVNTMSIMYCKIEDRVFFETLIEIEQTYIELINYRNWKPEQARAILPNCLKTEISMTANLREWIHILDLRTSKAAHPDMQIIANMCKDYLKENLPLIFDRNKE